MAQTGLLTCTRVARQVTLVAQVLARLAFMDRDMQPHSHVAILTFAFEGPFLVATHGPRRQASAPGVLFLRGRRVGRRRAATRAARATLFVMVLLLARTRTTRVIAEGTGATRVRFALLDDGGSAFGWFGLDRRLGRIDLDRRTLGHGNVVLQKVPVAGVEDT